MKKFLKKRWLGIPVAVITAVMLVMLLAGGAFAYTFFSGGATVTVSEAITWQCLGGDGSWDNNAGQWTVTMYPGETKTLNLQFSNASSVAITVDPVVTLTSAPSGWTGQFTCDFMSDTYSVPASGSCPANLQAVATASAPPGQYICTVTISR